MAVVVMEIAKPIHAFQMPQLLLFKGGPWVLRTNSTGKCLIGRNRQWLNSHFMGHSIYSFGVCQTKPSLWPLNQQPIPALKHLPTASQHSMANQGKWICIQIQAHNSCLQQTIGYLSNVTFRLQSQIVSWSSLKAIANWCLQTLLIWAWWCMSESGPCGDE